MRIESLEAQNHELQGDLKVMEQERLQWWQQQVCYAVAGHLHIHEGISLIRLRQCPLLPSLRHMSDVNAFY